MKKPKGTEEFHARLSIQKSERPIPGTLAYTGRLKAVEDRIKEIQSVATSSFIEYGNLFREVRDSKLYKERFPTFEAYCRETWNYSKQHVGNLINAAAEFGNVNKSLLPIENEGQARALAKIPKEKREKVLKEAKKSGKVSAKSIEKAAEVEDAEFEEKHLDKLGNEIPPKMWEAYSPIEAKVKAFMKSLSDFKCMVQDGIKDSDPHYAFSNSGTVVECENLYQSAKEILLFAICQSCHGKGCKDCRKRGYHAERLAKLAQKK